MPGTIFGVPTHMLVVHATAIGVPLIALAALAVALWPKARAATGVVALASLSLLLLVPATSDSGESLQEKVPESALLRHHTEMAGQLLPVVVVLAFGCVGLWIARRGTGPFRNKRWFRVVAPCALALTVLGSVASTVEVVRIGHAGAEASWHNQNRANGQ